MIPPIKDRPTNNPAILNIVNIIDLNPSLIIRVRKHSAIYKSNAAIFNTSKHRELRKNFEIIFFVYFCDYVEDFCSVAVR